MAATFFADYLKVAVGSHHTIAERLRKLLASALKRNTARHDFLAAMEAQLLLREEIKGGAPERRTKRRRATGSPQPSSKSRRAECPEQVVVVEDEPESPPTQTKLDEDTPLFLLPEAGPSQSGPAPTPHDPFLDEEPVATPPPTLPQNTVSRTMDVLYKQYTVVAAQAKRRRIGYFAAATMLAVASDGKQRRLSIDGIGSRVFRHRFGKRNPRDVMDAMEKMGLFISVWTGNRNRGSLSERPPADGPPGWTVRSASGRCGSLPQEIEGRIFRFGASFDEQHSPESDCGFYGVTLDVGKAVVGVYLPKDLDIYPPSKVKEVRKRERTNSADCRVRKAERLIRRQPPTTEEEHKEILATEPSQLLNSQGSPTEVAVTCPRTWRIFHSRPPHISALAWSAITPAMRAHHIRCLQKLQMMPAALLNQSIASTN